MTEENNQTPNHKQNEKSANEASFRSLNIPELNTGKLFFLGSLAFLFATIEPFALFASIPFTLSFLLYGKMKTFGMGLLGTLVAIALMQSKAYQGSAMGTYPLSLLYGLLISQSIIRKEHPLRGITVNGLGVFAIIATAIIFVNFSSKNGIEGLLTPFVEETVGQYLKSLESTVGAQGEQLRQLKDVMRNPALIVKPIINYGLGFIFVGVMLSFWVGTFVALRLSVLWKPFHSYRYDIKALTSFQVPYYLIYFLIVGLFLTVGSSFELFGPTVEVVGYNILLMLGIFYFFQGFGILSELLTYWRFFGFFRSMIIFFTVITGYHVIALVGVLDTWVNFRRFFVPKTKDESNDE